MEQPQPLGLLDVRVLFTLDQLLPLLAQVLGDLGVVYVGLELYDLLALDVREHHEGVHRPLDSVRRVLLGLKEGDVG